MSRREYDLHRKPKRSKAFELDGRIGKIHLLEGGAKRYELRIDAEGRWYHEGVEIVHDDIRNLFSRSLVRGEDGKYRVRLANDEFPVVVEDVPLVIVRVTEGSKGSLILLLNDGVTEKLDTHTIVLRDNVPYCVVRNNIEARFSRPAYYQLARFIEYDEKRTKYYIMAGGETVYLNAQEKE